MTPEQGPTHHRPGRHTRPLVDPEMIRGRRRVGRILVVAAAGVAMFASGVGMWLFFQHLFGDWWIVLPMFLLFDLAAVACAWNARINRLTYGRMGTEGWLVWLFATVSGFMSASDTTGRGAFARFAAPMVAAILFELLIRGERRDLTNHDGPVARIRRRVLARFGLLDDVDQDDEEAARARTAARIATLAYRVHQTRPGTRARRSAVRRYHRRLRTASVRMGFATDEAMVTEVRVHLDALYRSISGTGPDSVADLNVWQATEPDPVLELEPEPLPEPDAEPEPEPEPARVPPRAVMRPRQRRRHLPGRRRPRKRPQPAVPAAPEQVLALARDYAAGYTSGVPQIPAWRGDPDPTPLAVAPTPDPQAVAPAEQKRPAAVKTSRIRRADAGRRGKTSSSVPEDVEAEAYRFWQSERQHGRTPSAKQIADAVNVSKSTGHRWQQEWKTKEAAG